jgi:hypothetical protein
VKWPTVVGCGVRDVVHAGVGVGLHPELYAQKLWMTSSEVTLNCTGWFGQHELRGLEAAELRVAERPRPLLADHLDLQDVASWATTMADAAGGRPS